MKWVGFVVLADDILSALARNIVTNGYQASHANDELDETEFLKLGTDVEVLAPPELRHRIATTAAGLAEIYRRPG